jgi:HK97 family phage major capsid protein
MTFKHFCGVGLVAAVALIGLAIGIETAYAADGSIVASVTSLAITALPAAMPRDLVGLRALRATAFTEMEAALESSEPTAQADFDAATANVETVDRLIANADKVQKLRANSAIAAPHIISNNGDDVLAGFSESRRILLSAHSDLPVAQREQLVGYHERPFANLGEQMQAVHRLAVAHERDPRLVSAALGANETIPSDGGNLVQVDFSTEILRRTFDRPGLAAKVRKFPLGANSNGMKLNALKDNSRATGSRYGGVRGYWLAEAAALTASGPMQFRQMELNLKKLGALLYATDEQLQDAAFLEAMMVQAVSDEFAFLVDESIISGNGAGKPMGFMNAGCKVAVSKETGQAARTIVFENIQKMWSRLWAKSMPNAVWYINQDCYPQLNALSLVIGTGGVPVYLPPGGLSAAPFGTLMGRPVMPIEFCETVGTEGDIILADLSQYMLIDKSVASATSIHVAFLTGEQAFRFIYRLDGQPVDNLPITPYKGSATQSPFITLATRA